MTKWRFDSSTACFLRRSNGVGEKEYKVVGYVLIETEVGANRTTLEAIQAHNSLRCTVLKATSVTGPYDIILELQAKDLDHLGECITEDIQKIPGIKRTTTCLAVHLVGS